MVQDLIGTWKTFLKEGSFLLTSSELPKKFTGIIQVKPSDVLFLRDLQDKIVGLLPDQKPIDKLHVTLLHQSIPKVVYSKSMFDQAGFPLRGDKALKKFFKSQKGKDVLPPYLEFGELGIVEQDGRTSTYIKIVNEEDMRRFLSFVFDQVGLNQDEILSASLGEPREAGRIFHISLTNLTGSPGDSVANISSGTELEL